MQGQFFYIYYSSSIQGGKLHSHVFVKIVDSYVYNFVDMWKTRLW
jgi:hypothetical protein